MSKTNDEIWLLESIALSKKCPPTDQAFSVGAIIIGVSGLIISSGYSRERSSSEHAEELAIAKAIELKKDLTGTTIYSSLEPCNPRLSGKTSCADLIIKSGIKKVVFALYEPPIFVTCTGTAKLREHGIEVVVLDKLAHLVRQNNKQHFPELDNTTSDNENGSQNPLSAPL
jgi:diaminohydroxyphosphoribosylaminopyrimidine deaminase / 5-amino-6-(5-phosphoribosylamino)uracil reductase